MPYPDAMRSFTGPYHRPSRAEREEAEALARRAEAEADRLHAWIDAGCPPPPPTRPHWAPRTPYREDSPWETR